MELDWDYSKHMCPMSMPVYFEKFLAYYGHPQPHKPQLPPHHHSPISYGANTYQPAVPNLRPPLGTDGVKHAQGIDGALLWYGRAVDNKLFVALSAISSQQASATKATSDAIYQLLDYFATYLDDGITYCASNMVLPGHSDAAYLNKTCACSHAGTHIFLSEDDLMPWHNVHILTIPKIIKIFMSTDTKAKFSDILSLQRKWFPYAKHSLE